MQRLNELCGYNAIYDPQPHRARVQPRLEELLPQCIVGVVLEYVHNDEAAARRTGALDRRISSSQILREYGCADFLARLIAETRAVRVGLRRIRRISPRQYETAALAEDQWGTLYGCRYESVSGAPFSWISVPTFRLDAHTPPSIAIAIGSALVVEVDGATLDQFGTLWIDGKNLKSPQ
jgi:hypothetical protein